MGHKESVKDTARVLGRLYDGIEYRGFDQAIVETLAQYAGVPVWNGLTDQFHPTQILADMLTMREHCVKPIPEIAYAFLGDAAQQHGQLADDRRREAGHGRPARRADGTAGPTTGSSSRPGPSRRRPGHGSR